MLIRVAHPSKPAFQLRKGEVGISIFDTDAVDPPLTEAEILASFRPGSDAIALTVEAVENKGLKVVPIHGAPVLPDRLQEAHVEIQPGPGMSRSEFKQRLTELG